MDGSLDAPHVCQYAVLSDQLFKLGEISSIAGDRGAQENVAASFEIVVNRRACGVYGPLLYGKGKALPAFVKCDQFAARIVFPDRFGDGASDEPQPDKPCFCCCHICHPFRFL